jgi:hypothetical protein
MKKIYCVFFLMLFMNIGCAHLTAPSDGNPTWLDAMIMKFQREPVGNPPQSVWRYAYKGQTVYYIPAQCCDQFSTLFDANGNVLCAPDGGITGGGDRRCPDFFTVRTNETLIWSDQRGRGKALSQNPPRRNFTRGIESLTALKRWYR